MIQLRWLVRDGVKILQYRQQYNATIYAGMPSKDFVQATEQLQWSGWVDVPEETDPHELRVTITAEMVNHLRDKTDEPMMECKKALVACNGDMSKAMDWLRTKPRPRLYV